MELRLGCQVLLAAISIAMVSSVLSPVKANSLASEEASTEIDLTELSIEELMNVEITSASKKPEQLSKTPAAVFIIDHEDITRFGYTDLSEILRRVTGMYVNSDRNYSYLGVRGYARPGDYNTRVLLLIDGHRINDPLYDMATIEQSLPLDVRSIERIEVVKGPGSALWGTNALLAVINIITRTGRDMEGGRAAAGYQSYGGSNLYLEYGESHENGFEIAAAVSTTSTNGQESIYFPEFDDPSTNNGVAQGLDGEKASKGYISASYKGLDLLYISGTRKKDIPTAPWDAYFNYPGTFTVDERSLMEISYKKNINPDRNGNLLLRVYKDHYYYYGDYIYDYGLEEPVIYSDMAESNWCGAEVCYSQDLSPKLSATFGAEYVNVYQIVQEGYDVDPYYEYCNLSSSFTQRSFYIQADFEILDNLKLTAGTRLDNYSTFGSNWSPRAAVVYCPSQKTSLKLLYGNAFRAPNEYERTYTSVGGPIANYDLEPEHIETTEIVWEQRMGKNSRLVTSLFHFCLDDIITQVELPEGDLQFQNLDSIESSGVEISFEAKTDSGQTGYMGISATDVRDKATESSISNSPQFTAVGGISMPLNSRRMYISPEVQYVGNRTTLLEETCPGYAVVNLTIGTNNPADCFNYTLSVHNLFDTQVYVPGSYEHAMDLIPQDGRTFNLQASYRL